MLHMLLTATKPVSDDLFKAGIIEQMGTALAVPGIVEKGYLDVRIEVTSQGGHSSVPPSHTVSLGSCGSFPW